MICRSPKLATLLSSVVAVLAVSLSTTVARAEPLTLLEIRFYLGQGKSSADVVAMAKQRGLSFEVDAASEAALLGAGLEPQHLQQLKELSKPSASADNPKPATTPAPHGDDANPTAPAVADGARTWTDKTGKYNVAAQFVDFKEGEVVLKLADGSQRSVRMSLLSNADQDYVRQLLRNRREAATSSADSVGPPDDPNAPLTVEQRKQVTFLVGSFRRAYGDAEKRDELVEELFKYGEVGVKQLQEIVNKELYGQLEDYADNYKQRASNLYRDRVSQVSAAEVQQLRSKVLALKEDANLSKQRIVAEGNPALEKLRSLLVIARDAVLEDEALREQRAKLIGLSQYWDRIEKYLAKDQPAPPPGEDGAAAGPSTFEEYLSGEEDIVAQLAMPMRPENRTVLASNARIAPQIDREEARAIMACNLMRNLLGLNVLAIDVKLCAAGRDHSKDMVTLKFFAHESPVEGKKLPWDRAARFGTSASAENIFYGSTDGARANMAWFHSPGHHKNMLSAHQRIGMGRHETHFTEMFGN